MKYKTQTAWLRNQLLNHRRVTRNQALSRYFSRLSARILELKKQGWNIEGHPKETKNGRDFEYTLKNE